MEVVTHKRMSLDISEDTAHTVEVKREENEKGELGSFGFTLLYEKPPIVGTIVPGGPAERAGLRKNDCVLTVNGRDVRYCSHIEVVSLIANTPSASVWLSVCEPSQKNSFTYGGGGLKGGLGSFHMSQSTPVLPRGIMDSPPKSRKYIDDSPPKYTEFVRYPNGQLGNRAYVSASVANISPWQRKVLTQGIPNGHTTENGHSHDIYDSPKPTPKQRGIPGSFTSASVLVLYIGPVEIPGSWSDRGISSKCIQECTRRLLSQRQEFIEVFLEMTLSTMKVLNVSRNCLVKHKRDELFYCGVCTDDEQYFAVVTRKTEAKTSQKLVIDPEVGQTVPSDGSKQARASICHVFKVIPNKSVLVLHGGDKKTNPEVKAKTIPITSCVTIVNAVKGLFIAESGKTTKLFEDSSSHTSGSSHSLRVGPSNMSFSSVGSSGSGGSTDSFPIYGTASDKSKKKKLEVVDLRPMAYNQSASSTTYDSSPGSKKDYPSPVATPAFLHTGSAGKTWYTTSSPKEISHARTSSWDYKDRPTSGNFTERLGANFDLRKAKKISDDSSVSSLSSSRTPSPTKLSFRSSLASRSRSPSPIRSLSVSSSGDRSRSPSPVKYMGGFPRSASPERSGPIKFTASASKLSQGLALETPAFRAMSPTSIASSMKGSRLGFRRQGSESSVMDAIQAEQQMLSYRSSLPQKNVLMTSSIGSVATLTTMADEECGDQTEDVGRVGGWIASFDKLLADPLGVQCLLQLLEKEHCEENILFWRDVEQFKQTAASNQNLQQAVKKLFDEYLHSSAPYCINIDDRIKKAIESKLSNPPPNIFNEAQEHIYQLMKMDCYPRFQKSQLVKDCMMAEVEGNPLPIDLPQQQKQPQPPQYNWKKSRSFFGRWSRPRVMAQQQSLRVATSSWGIPPEPRKGKKEGKAGGKKGKAADSKGKGQGQGDEKQEDFPPDDHLHFLQTHRGNLFEVNLPNKVTKILSVPGRGTVKDAIRPVLKKHGYSFDIMELRFASTFKPVDLSSPASILTGQHISAIKSKNTFTAVFPDVPEKILPANGTRTIGALFTSVLKEIGKQQNFAVYLEGSRVPLELGIDTSVVVGQRVVVKYLPANAKPSGSAGSSPMVSGKLSKSSSESGEPPEGMDELFSMIHRLASDTLHEQRTSPGTSPEPGNYAETTPTTTTAPVSHQKPSEGEQKERQRQQQQRTSPSSGSGSHERLYASRQRSSSQETKKMHVSRSSDHLQPEGVDGGYRQLLHPNVSRNRFTRTQSGATISNTIKAEPLPQRAFSPPAVLSQRDTSPPPPSSKPPPLPHNVQRRMAEMRVHQQHRLSGSSYKSTDSEGSMTAELHRYSDHIYVNRGNRSVSVGTVDAPRYFPGAYPTMERGHVPVGQTNSIPLYVNSTTVQEHTRSSSMSNPRNRSPSNPGQQHPLDNLVNEAYTSAPPGGYANVHHRQQSWPKRGVDPNSPLHALRGPPPQPGTSISNYPWHRAHPHRRFPIHGTQTSRRMLTENVDLLEAGERIVQQEIEDYRRSSSDTSSNSDQYRTPLSPTTHMLVVPDDENSPNHQHETFV